jgi:hypothetical protein
MGTAPRRDNAGSVAGVVGETESSKQADSNPNGEICDCLQEGQDNDCPTAVDQPPNAALFASAYAFIGLRPIALRQNSKIPSIGAWQDTPALTPDQVAVKFQNHSGNLGCTFPTNLFALDVDCKEGAQGYESLSALEDVHGPLPVTLTQRTPSGGEHRLFKKHASIIIDNKTGFLPGLDIRATRGQIAVEPSSIDGKPYYWIDWSPSDGEIPEIADAPQWLIEAIQGNAGTTTNKPTNKPDNSCKEIWVAPPVLADLASALEYINPTPYDSWINVGARLRELGEPGFRLWDAWSQSSEKYEQEEMRRKWRGFSHERTGYKAVFTEATKNGWANPLSNASGGAQQGAGIGQPPPQSEKGAPGAGAGLTPCIVSLSGIAEDSGELPHVVEKWLPCDEVTLLAGHGGGGKSYVALNLALHVALGRQFGTLPVTQTPVVFSQERMAHVCCGNVWRVFATL